MMTSNILFCKQKTAYEMRISDWSSDVCSSDLPISLAKLNRDITVMPGLNGAFRNGGARLRGEDGQRREGGKDDNTELQESISFDSICKIGRATWRERVCTNV